ncbi:MAG: GTP-binding protein [Planctomycetaceae bacterium]|nr:GTP-binding protein [Planctomycetaceae bacterium]
MSPVQTHLITGFLGAGKTSAIISLLESRPANERWAVLVNEYGMVSLDHILLNDRNWNSMDPGESSSDADEGLTIDEMAGGCFCCTLSDSLPQTLIRLIRRSQPHRLIIEPTGSGHPASVIDLLRSGRMATLVDLRSTICLIDPRDYENPRITNSEVFRDQIQMADIAVINFTDKCAPDQIRRCRDFIAAQDPPKLVISETSMGKLDPAWLDVDGTVIRDPYFQNAHNRSPISPQIKQHSHRREPESIDDSNDFASRKITEAKPGLGTPLHFQNSGLGQNGAGWIFHPGEIFLREAICEVLEGLQPLLRLKAILHLDDDWWAIQRRANDFSMTRSAYRRDSRIEVICESDAIDFQKLDQDLRNCIVK